MKPKALPGRFRRLVRREGEVLAEWFGAHGDGNNAHPHDDKDAINVKPKDHVMYDKYAGTSVTIDGDDHLIVKAADILAIIG